jgi:hypothetical protein
MVRAPLDSTEKYVAVTRSSSDQNFTNFVKQIRFRPMKILICYGKQLNIWTVVLTTWFYLSDISQTSKLAFVTAFKIYFVDRKLKKKWCRNDIGIMFANPDILIFISYWSACTKPEKWAVMYLCVRGIDVICIYYFDIWFWNCFDGVVFSAYIVVSS